MTYLNHAGTSWPKPEPVRAAVARALESSPASWPEDFDAGHARIAAALGIGDPGRLLLTPGCTSALALAVADLPWEPGDRVVISGLEHHALARPTQLLEARGVERVVLPRATDGPLDLERLRDELRQGGARLVAMTAACNVTGELLPVPEVVALAHEHGALCLVDGAQVAGWIDLDLASLEVDLFAFAAHKGLQAPWGLGGLYVAPHVSLASPSAACELPAPGQPPACSTMPGYCDAGSVDRVALAGLVAALDWLDAPARADRLERARAHVERLTDALEERPGVRLHGTRPPRSRLPTIAFSVEGRRTAELAQDLGGRGLVVGAGLQCAPLAHEALGTAPSGVVRLSAGPATSDEDVESALEALTTL
jgi:selenocysteine lyase/cysteine desulfurase